MRGTLKYREKNGAEKALILLFLSVSSLGLRAADRPGISTSDPVIFTVRMATSLKTPEGIPNTESIRVWHALPPRKSWSLFTGQVGATGIQFSSGGRQDYEAKHDSHHIFWEITSQLGAGESHRFLSQFEVRSMRRMFRPEEVKVEWEQIESIPPLVKASCEERLAEIHPRLQTLADEIRGRVGPTTAVIEFCRWIGEHVLYDASFPFETSNVDAIVTREKGHCGHQAAVFRQLCAAVGIPVRTIQGLNLYEEDGIGELHEIRKDFTNIHTWLEVYFPGVGWVEVDPVGRNNPYLIPAHLIENNRWFQNYSVWIRVEGENRQPRWIPQDDGTVLSEYGIENVISFRSRKG